MVTNHARNRNTTSMLIHKLQDKFSVQIYKGKGIAIINARGNIDSQFEYS